MVNRKGFATFISAVVVVGLVAGAMLLAQPRPGTVRAGDNSWTRIGPWGGVVSRVAVSPIYPVDHTVFAATRGGGLPVARHAARRRACISPIPA